MHEAKDKLEAITKPYNEKYNRPKKESTYSRKKVLGI